MFKKNFLFSITVLAAVWRNRPKLSICANNDTQYMPNRKQRNQYWYTQFEFELFTSYITHPLIIIIRRPWVWLQGNRTDNYKDCCKAKAKAKDTKIVLKNSLRTSLGTNITASQQSVSSMSWGNTAYCVKLSGEDLLHVIRIKWNQLV